MPVRMSNSHMPRLTGGGSGANYPVSRCVSDCKSITSIPRKRSEKSARGGISSAAFRRHKVPVNQQEFAEQKDGKFYPVVRRGVSALGTKVIFSNSNISHVQECDILSATKLSAGDVIGVKDGCHGYVWGIVLEYHTASDEIIVARKDGTVTM